MKTTHVLLATALASTLQLAAATASGGGGGDWPHWRGPGGTGVARGPAPLEWSDTKNVLWMTEVPGRGVSTPIAWGERLFLTTAIALEGDSSEGALVEHAFDVLALDRATGTVEWQVTARKATPHEGFHRQYGSFASASPATDGERLYVSFGSRGLYCYDLDGELLWEKDFGVEMEMRRAFGEGSAPVVHGDALIQMFDHEGASFMVVLDKRTGELRWRAERDEPSSWATPLVIEHGGITQVVTPGTTAVRSYDLATGEVVWWCEGLGTNCIPQPVLQDETLIVMSGHRNPNVLAIRLGGEGDLSGTESVVWQNPKGASYTASPVLLDGRLYCLKDRGFLSCFDARSGEEHYLEARLPRGSQFKASPIAADGHLYLAAESGDVFVVRAGDELEIVATNTLEGQTFVASPLALDGNLFLRSQDGVYCIGAPK